MKDVRASQGAFISLFSRMEYFFLRLEKYIKVRPTVAMRDIIVKIMAEVLSILGIMTKEIGQGSMSASFRIDILYLQRSTFVQRSFSRSSLVGRTSRMRFSGWTN